MKKTVVAMWTTHMLRTERNMVRSGCYTCEENWVAELALPRFMKKVSSQAKINWCVRVHLTKVDDNRRIVEEISGANCMKSKIYKTRRRVELRCWYRLDV